MGGHAWGSGRGLNSDYISCNRRVLLGRDGSRRLLVRLLLVLCRLLAIRLLRVGLGLLDPGLLRNRRLLGHHLRLLLGLDFRRPVRQLLRRLLGLERRVLE